MPANLKPIAGSPGLWRTGAPAGSAGTYAFIVGVSKYDRLDGSYQNLGLDSLYVSALTAFRFFKYLADTYVFEDGSLFEATLLLSPTDIERPLIAADPYGVTEANAPRPTLQTFREQLQLWRARLAELTPEAKAKSRTFFFFSGHGLELDPDRQLLLPCDYPGLARTYNDAISTRNIWQGLGSLPIPSQFFFIDACRNDVPTLYALSGLTGVTVFDEWRGGSKAEAPIFYASAPGDSAWQPTTATCLDDNSFYGKALLDALLVRDPRFQLDHSTTPSTITVFPLYTYVRTALLEKLRQNNINQPRPVMLGGAVANSVISHWIEPSPRPVVGLPPPAAPQPPAAPPPPPHPTPSELRVGRDLLIPPWTTPDGFRGRHDTDVLRTELGNDTFYAFLRAAEIFHWVPGLGWTSSADDFTVLRTERSPNGANASVDFIFEDASRWRWIQVSAKRYSPNVSALSYGFLVPTSSINDPTFAFEFTAPLTANGRPANAISDVILRLSDYNTNASIADAARLWSAYANASSLGALEELDNLGAINSVPAKDVALRLLDEKSASPLAATIAALVLLRTELSDELRGWYDNLALNVSESSDAAVFCLQSLIRRGEYDQRNAWMYLERIADFGTPVTAEACAYLMNFISDTLETKGPSPFGNEFRDEMGDYVRNVLGPVGKMINPFRKVASALRTGGLFTTVASRDDELKIDWFRAVMA